MDKVTVPLVIDLPFENKDMELTFTYEADPDALEAYNQQYKTSFELLTGDYTTPELKIKAGEVSATAEIEVNPATLQYDPDVVKAYMLPIRITGCDNPTVKIQENAVTYAVVQMRTQWTGTWTVTMLEKEANMGANVGWTGNVKLYSKRAVLANPGIGQDAAAATTDDEAIFFPTWGGTGYEQCSSIVKITDEDYDASGKKKIEIIKGNAGAYWWDFGEQTFNNSWYDPVNNIIHLEYDGKQGWGDTRYYIHREYSNPQFDGV